DYEVRRDLLPDATAEAPPGISTDAAGVSKMWMILRLLHFRRTYPELFAPGSTYEPLSAEGPRADRVFAFARSAPSAQGAAGGAGERVVVVVPRVSGAGAGTDPDWEGTTLELPRSPHEWADLLGPRCHASGRVPVSDMLNSFPVAVLVPR
ncbi:MAG: hypothetical protein ACRDYC_02995, partial [Acidimicrobiales bacterium]